MVARLLEVCLIEISSFRKELLFFFCDKLNLISEKNSSLLEVLSLQNHLSYSIKL